MNAFKEYRDYKQSRYGNYCSLCREMNMEIKSYDKFTIEDIKVLKMLRKEKLKSLNPMTIKG